jgi:amino acid permease
LYGAALFVSQLPNERQFIAVSAVIGGVFAPTAQALKIAGPAGALLAVAVGGIVAISVMECVSEFVQLFPSPNAIVDIIAAFVCEDLGLIIGIAYWCQRRFPCTAKHKTDMPDKVHLYLHLRQSVG